MTVSAADWAGQLQESLEHWSKGRLDLGGRGLQQVIRLLQGPANGIWRALLHNQLALLSRQLGHEKYAREQWDLAQSCWREGGYAAGSVELKPTLDWYCQLLDHYGFQDRAREVRRLSSGAAPPLLDPFVDLGVAQDLVSQSFAPLGGKTLAEIAAPAQGPSGPSSEPREWEGLVALALEMASQGKLPPALGRLDRAKELALRLRDRDGGHVLCLVYCAESLAAFVAGDYSTAGQARQEAVRIWSEIQTNTGLFSDGTHEKFIAALRQGGQPQAALVFEARHQQQTFPVLDPWSDLEVGLQKGNWQAESFSLSKEWQPRLEQAFKLLHRQNTMEALKELGLLEQRLLPDQQRAAPGALLLQMQALVSYAAGDYDAAQELFRRAMLLWDSLGATARNEPPFLEQFRSLLVLFSLPEMAEALGDSLCDPFVYYKPGQEMARVSGGKSEDAPESEDSRESWERLLREAWSLAARGRWEQALRTASQSQRVARLLSENDLRVAYSLNSQAIFSYQAGNYQDADELLREAVLGWKRGAHSPSARTAWSEFCQVLSSSSWELLGAKLQAMWDQPVVKSAFDPALLPVDSLAERGMPTVEMEEEEPLEADGVLRLPSTSPKNRAPRRKQPVPLVVGLLVLLALVAAFVLKLKFSGP